MSFADRPVSQPENLGGSMSEQLTREQAVEILNLANDPVRWAESAGYVPALCAEVLALMDNNDRLREAAVNLRQAVKDQVAAGQPVSPKVAFACAAVAALAVPEGETK